MWFGLLLIDEADIPLASLLKHLGLVPEHHHALCEVDLHLVSAESGNLVLLLVRVEREFPVRHTHLLEHAREENLGVHLLTELDGPVGHEYLHPLVVQTAALAIVNHEYVADAVESGHTCAYLIAHSNVLHLFQCVHELDPVDTAPARSRLYTYLRDVVRVTLHLLIDGLPE